MSCAATVMALLLGSSAFLAHAATPACSEQGQEKALELMRLATLLKPGFDLELVKQQLGTMAETLPPGFEREFQKLLATSLPELQQSIADVYCRSFSVEELGQLIEFNSTPIGQKATRVLPQLLGEMMLAQGAWARSLAARALGRTLGLSESDLGPASADELFRVRTTALALRQHAAAIDEKVKAGVPLPQSTGFIPLSEIAKSLVLDQEDDFNDAWGRPLLYRSLDRSFALVSTGLDGIQSWSPEAAVAEPLLTDFGSDIVFASGVFRQYPGARLARGEFGGELGSSPLRPSADEKDARAPEVLNEGIKPPTLTTRVAPDYPELQKWLGVEGRVILQIVVDEAGKVAAVKVLRSIIGLDDAAIDAVRRWQYEPGMRDGVPLKVYVTVTVNFKLR